MTEFGKFGRTFRQIRQICQLSLCFKKSQMEKLKKGQNACPNGHPSFYCPWLLNFSDLTIHSLTFVSCLHCAKSGHFKDGWALNFVFFTNRQYNPQVKCFNCAQYKYEPTMRTKREDGQITEVSNQDHV